MKTPDFLRSAAFGVGAAMLVSAASMMFGPGGTLASVGIVLLLLVLR